MCTDCLQCRLDTSPASNAHKRRPAPPSSVVDEIVWCKMTVNWRLAKSHGYYLQHAKEVCASLHTVQVSAMHVHLHRTSHALICCTRVCAPDERSNAPVASSTPNPKLGLSLYLGTFRQVSPPNDVAPTKRFNTTLIAMHVPAR